MAQVRKYANLPDVDSAPDIYETTPSADQNRPHTRTSSASSTSSAYRSPGADDEESESGISRAGLRPGDARSAFRTSRVDARDVDFSDRVAGGRRSYRVPSARRRNGVFDSEEPEEESLEEKLARLSREVEEVRVAAASQEEGKKTSDVSALDRLEQVLKELSTGRQSNTHDTPMNVNQAPESASEKSSPHVQAKDLLQQSLPDMSQTTRALSLAADLERRLSTLETALGLPSLSLPLHSNAETSGPGSRPILATLTQLDHQMNVLASATGPGLATLSTQIQQLTRDSESLASARKEAQAARVALREKQASSRPISGSFSRPLSYAGRPMSISHPSTSGSAGVAEADSGMDANTLALLSSEDTETMARINKLYDTLPTVEALAPLLPGTLERLRSLNLLHQDAATASESLTDLEKRQASMADELIKWRQGLEAVETKITETSKLDSSNRQSVETWVKELEQRIDKF